MVLPQGGVHLFQGGEYSPPPTGWLDKPLIRTMSGDLTTELIDSFGAEMLMTRLCLSV